MVDLAVGHEVPHANPLAAAVVDLHVADDAALHGGRVAVSVRRRELPVVAVACSVSYVTCIQGVELSDDSWGKSEQ